MSSERNRNRTPIRTRSRAFVMLTLAGLAIAAGSLLACGSSHESTARAQVAAVGGTPPGTQPTAPTPPSAPPSAPTAPSRPPAVSTPTGSAAPLVPAPRIVWDPIPFGAERKAQMVAYARRHYGSFMRPTYRLLHPRVIVIHYTETPDFSSTFNTFAPDVPDSELHELPGTCAHFVIDQHGVIHQLVPLSIMCRHTVGLNWTAIGIEHVGYSDGEVLDNRAQMAASLRLVRWLRCRYRIGVGDVIGHNESLSSRYHHEDVAALRTQTHSDFVRADMQVYRARLRAQGGCPPATG
jgi:N-acetylmuramoyl-L-alanine amidase